MVDGKEVTDVVGGLWEDDCVEGDGGAGCSTWLLAFHVPWHGASYEASSLEGLCRQIFYFLLLVCQGDKWGSVAGNTEKAEPQNWLQPGTECRSESNDYWNKSACAAASCRSAQP